MTSASANAQDVVGLWDISPALGTVTRYLLMPLYSISLDYSLSGSLHVCNWRPANLDASMTAALRSTSSPSHSQRELVCCSDTFLPVGPRVWIPFKRCAMSEAKSNDPISIDCGNAREGG